VKKIGIVGGLSPESTALYYRTIISEFRRRFKSEDYSMDNDTLVSLATWST